MPTPYIKRLSEDQDIPLQKLEEYWNKAKSLAAKYKDKGGVTYWKYVMAIFKNIAKVNGVSVSAAYESLSRKVAKLKKTATKSKKPVKPKKPIKPEKPSKPSRPGKTPVKKVKEKNSAVALPEWWVKKSEMSKAKYVAAHPGSKFVKHVAAKNPKLRKVLVQAQKDHGMKVDVPPADEPDTDTESGLEKDHTKVANQIRDMSEKAKQAEQKKHVLKVEKAPTLDEEEVDEDSIMPAGGPSDKEKEAEFEEQQKALQIKHKSIFHRAYFKARLKINHALKRDKIGKHCVGKFLTGHKLTDNEKKHAKAWAGTAAKLVLGVAVGAAMFTPLAGMAPELGQHFLTLLMGGDTSESSEGVERTKGKIVPIGNPDKFEPSDFTDRLHDWLMEQDIPALVEQLKSKHHVARPKFIESAASI